MVATKGAGQEAAATDLEARRNVGSGNARPSKPQPQNPQAPAKSWRDVLPVHPAADLFPLMSADELKALGEDIKKNGLKHEVVLWSPGDCGDGAKERLRYLLDGRNRLDAMERAGIKFLNDKGEPLEIHGARFGTEFGERVVDKWVIGGRGRGGKRRVEPNIDPYAYVISANIHRRHLTAEQKRELIAKLIKATPEKSNRQVAETVKVDHKTVGTVRADLEGRGEIPHVESRTDTKGRNQPARKTRPKRHFCRHCGVRAPVGEVQQHNTSDPYYEGDDIWLHDACVAAWEAQEATDRAELDDIEAQMFDPDSDSRPAFMLRADQARLFAVYSGPVDEDVCSIAREVLAAWTLLVERLTTEMKAVSPLAPDDDLGIPPFLRRAAP